MKEQKYSIPLFTITIVFIGMLFYFCGKNIVKTSVLNLEVKYYNCVLRLFIPQISMTQQKNPVYYEDALTTFLPVISYTEEIFAYENQPEETLSYEQLAIKENQQMSQLLQENDKAREQGDDTSETWTTQKQEDLQNNQSVKQENEASTQTTNQQIANADNSQEIVEASSEKKMEYSIEQMRDFDYLSQNFYIIDGSTTTNSEWLNVDQFMAEDLHLDKNTDAPQILIYHTHASETYCDSVEGDPNQTVVGVGNRLTELLTNQYGWNVLHDTQVYDTVRDYAYSVSAPSIEQILAENPSIEMVIDLHRDSVPETTHLVSQQNGKPTAKIMFFNGMCYSTTQGALTSYPNPYLKQNLALSFQMQKAAGEYYPEFTRKIYLKAYRYNMHFRPRSTLIEVGAQNNTFEEAVNAMEPLADVINKVLSGGNK